MELAIQAEAAYRQEIDAGRLHNKDRIQRKVDSFGEMAQQLYIRGEVRKFDDEFIQLLRDFGYGCGEFSDAPTGIGQGLEDDWKEEVKLHVEEIKDNVDVSK